MIHLKICFTFICFLSVKNVKLLKLGILHWYIYVYIKVIPTTALAVVQLDVGMWWPQLLLTYNYCENFYNRLVIDIQ